MSARFGTVRTDSALPALYLLKLAGGDAARVERDAALLSRTLAAVGDRFARHHARIADALASCSEPLLAANRLLDLPAGYDPGARADEFFDRFCRIAAQSGVWGRAVARQPQAAMATPAEMERASLTIDAMIRGAAAGETTDELAFVQAQRWRRLLWYADLVDGEASGRRDVIHSAERITRLAELVVEDTLRWVTATDPTLARLRVCVLGMGKLGSRELNPSSDIDLIVLFDPVEPSESDAADSARAVRRLVALIEHRESGAPIFRVDLRLRPFGTQGAAAWRRDHALAYYERHGRPWERLAMLRARPIAGDLAVGELLLKRLRPFVFRRNLDPGALAEIAAMKGSIDAERRRRDAVRDAPGFDVKLGEGGIREVEFLVQALVLVWGGRLGAGYAPSTSQTLLWLVEQGLMPDGDAVLLRQAYGWLRLLEHRIQFDEDRQTHEIPQGAAGDLLARRLGFTDLPALHAATDVHRVFVHAAWRRLFGGEGWSEVDSGVAWVANAVSRAGAHDVSLPPELERVGFSAPVRAAASLARMAATGEPLLGSRSSQRARRVGEKLIDLCARASVPDAALDRIVDIAASARGREVLVRVCEADLRSAQVLVTMLSASEPLGRLVAREPRLLESLLTAAGRQAKKSGADFMREISDMYGAASRDGRSPSLEVRQERLRRYRAIEEARIAFALLTGRLDVRAVCEQLSSLAAELVRVCGQEALTEGGLDAQTPVAALGFGKLGGGELGFGGDLDLVFVCGNDVDRAKYSRVVRRWIALLHSPLRYGKLYEVDTRLRPDGGSGMVVSSVEALGDYYAERAWGYELVALWRASPCASVAGCGEEAALTIDNLLRRVDIAAVESNLWEIRDRRVVSERETRRIKTCPGGLMDLEIAIHVASLRAWREGTWPSPRVGNTWDCIAQLAAIDVLSEEQAAKIDAALTLLRRVECWIRLGDGKGGEELPRGRALVAIEARVLGSSSDGTRLEAAVEEARASVLELLATLRR